MVITETFIKGVFLIQPKVYEDDRGYFFECYNKAVFELAGIKNDFVQDNQSKSQKNVLRGLHFQKEPHAQGKLVRVFSGAVLDVVVDIRKGSSTYGKYYSCELNESNKKMLWIPPGLAHGFLTIEDNTVFFYKCTALYNKDSEAAIRWNDPILNINWGVLNPIISEKDKNAMFFKDY